MAVNKNGSSDYWPNTYSLLGHSLASLFPPYTSYLFQVNPKFTKVVHGNTMTAAAVCANVVRLAEETTTTTTTTTAAAAAAAGENKKVFLTGPTSKVGGAVALYLASKGFEVVCCTRSQERFLHLQSLLPQGTTGKVTRAVGFADGKDCSTWIVGKYEPEITTYIPSGAHVVVFSTPDPMNPKQRPDLHIIDGARFVLQEGTYTTRRNSLLLPGDTLYGCHTGGIVHAASAWASHEIGEVDWSKIDSYLQAASFMKVRLPPLFCPSSPSSTTTSHQPPASSPSSPPNRQPHLFTLLASLPALFLLACLV